MAPSSPTPTKWPGNGLTSAARVPFRTELQDEFVVDITMHAV
jgi:hypothetical protein